MTIGSGKKITINDIQTSEIISSTNDCKKVDSVASSNDNPELIANTENIANTKDNDVNKKY